jgi:hypothetical protein
MKLSDAIEKGYKDFPVLQGFGIFAQWQGGKLCACPMAAALLAVEAVTLDDLKIYATIKAKNGASPFDLFKRIGDQGWSHLDGKVYELNDSQQLLPYGIAQELRNIGA